MSHRSQSERHNKNAKILCKRFDETGKDQRADHKPRRGRILTPRFKAGLKRSVNANLALPLFTLAKKRSISTMKIHRALKKLGLTSFSQGKRHLLTKKIKSSWPGAKSCWTRLSQMAQSSSFFQTRRFSWLMRLSISGMIAG